MDVGSADGPPASARDARVVVAGVTKTFTRRSGEKVPAIDDVTLSIEEGDFLVLLGPSGCGKTTLLRSIAGLETLDRGVIQIEGRTVVDTAAGVDVPPERRRISMMFQSYALWPHMSVYDNVAYALVSRKVPRADVRGRVERVLDAVGVRELARQYPNQISGGQQQRVALARALVAGDGVVLFDEPLSNVDAKVREQLRAEILRLHRSLGFTAVYVTHDQDEAMALATRIAVLRAGRVAQCSTPRAVYSEPAEAYVARFMGATNEITGTVAGRGPAGELHVRTAVGLFSAMGGSHYEHGDEVTVFTRPEAWRFTGQQPAGGVNAWPGSLEREAFQGFYVDRHVRLQDEVIRVRELAGTVAPAGEGWLSIDPADVLVLHEDAS